MRGRKRVPVEDQCRVYWGSHGCHKRAGHAGPHRCDHGCPWPAFRDLAKARDPESDTDAGEHCETCDGGGWIVRPPAQLVRCPTCNWRGQKG